MKKLFLTCILLACVSAVSFGQAMRDLTPAELTVAQDEARTKADGFRTPLSLTTTQYNDLYDAEFLYQKQYDKYVVNVVTPSSGQLGNITIQRDTKIESILTPAQYATYLTLPH
jgi:hypothetical protein